jgi:hypothetical protein
MRTRPGSRWAYWPATSFACSVNYTLQVKILLTARDSVDYYVVKWKISLFFDSVGHNSYFFENEQLAFGPRSTLFFLATSSVRRLEKRKSRLILHNSNLNKKVLGHLFSKMGRLELIIVWTLVVFFALLAGG